MIYKIIFVFDLLKSPMPFALSWRLNTFDPAMNKNKEGIKMSLGSPCQTSLGPHIFTTAPD